MYRWDRFKRAICIDGTGLRELYVQMGQISIYTDRTDLRELFLTLQVRQIYEKLPSVCQKLFLSATIPPRIERMANELLDDALMITIGEVGERREGRGGRGGEGGGGEGGGGVSEGGRGGR